MNTNKITTARLYLRPFTINDLDAFFSLCSNPEMMHYIGEPDSRVQAQARLENWLTYRSEQGLGAWAVFEKSSDRFAGYGFLRALEQPSEAEIGYGMAKAYWGRGLTTELATALLQWGFQMKFLEQIVGFVHPENIASCRVMEKLGMQDGGLVDRHGLLRKYYSMARQGFELTNTSPES